MTQVWHSVVDTLRLLPTVPSKSGESTLHETQTIDEAIEKLDLLISMRKGVGVDARTISSLHGSGGVSNPVFSVNVATPDTPSSTPGAGPGGGGSGVKRKRRPSPSVSPAPPALNTGISIDSNLSSLNSPLPPSGRGQKDRSATPISRDQHHHQNQMQIQGGKSQTQTHHSSISKKEPYADQLPLQVGRRVAFRMPAKDGEEQEWILATVKRCLLQDKTRYEVVDADDPTK